MTRPQERDELLRRVVVGEITEGDPEMRRALEEDEELRTEYERLKSIADKLDHYADERRSVLAEIESVDEVPGMDRVDATLRPLAAQLRASHDAGAHPALPRWVLALAALVLISVIAYIIYPKDDGGSAIPPEIPLGKNVSYLEPGESVSSYQRFAWSFELPEGWSYRLTIEDQTEQADPIVIRGLSASEWIPDRELSARIRWWIDVVEPGGKVQISGPIRHTERSP